ncbi:heterokaryon incompatibility protein het-6 [Colletotrichum asianum]
MATQYVAIYEPWICNSSPNTRRCRILGQTLMGMPRCHNAYTLDNATTSCASQPTVPTPSGDCVFRLGAEICGLMPFASIRITSTRGLTRLALCDTYMQPPKESLYTWARTQKITAKILLFHGSTKTRAIPLN